jgi:hypothetical protein
MASGRSGSGRSTISTVDTIPDIVGFTLASVLIELTPGPNMSYLATLAAPAVACPF